MEVELVDGVDVDNSGAVVGDSSGVDACAETNSPTAFILAFRIHAWLEGRHSVVFANSMAKW